ncbi:fatty-acid-binding protein [Thalictrum thalictroides]|uniref:Fatty-acid-binding protein n=1 Tax=Thalictrum thalictroides TaxID=46969 RepID=A0A7J6VYG0_THATH|nr:fatty-acid-binding protein [Thalictrum thalictroides]
MVSLRFPFLFSQPTKLPHNPSNGSSSRWFSTIAMAGSIAAIAGVGIGMGVVSISHKNTNKKDPFLQKTLDFFLSRHNTSLPLWGSLSLADTSSENVVETKTGTSFPTILNDTQKLLGIGLRKKSVFGLKNIDVYAFGVYADDSDLKKVLGEKYGRFSVSELKENKEFHEDIMDKDVSMTVRLQIVYGRLSIRSVRSSFEESLGSRLQKLGGTDGKEVLQR